MNRNPPQAIARQGENPPENSRIGSMNLPGHLDGASGYGVPPLGGGAPASSGGFRVLQITVPAHALPPKRGTPYPEGRIFGSLENQSSFHNEVYATIRLVNALTHSAAVLGGECQHRPGARTNPSFEYLQVHGGPDLDRGFWAKYPIGNSDIRAHPRNQRLIPRAFTLVELLVVIGIIAILAALLLPGLAKAKNRAHLVEEMSAGRQLMLGVRMYADDHNDSVFPGYVDDPMAVDDQGQPLFFPENARYPWRMVPYLAGSMSLIYSGVNRAKLNQLQSESHSDYVYAVSLYPSLGINSYFIGGNQTEFPAGGANPKYGDGTVITKMNQADHPADLMVFMSARSEVTGNNAQGYYQITPPYLAARQWAPNYYDGLPPNQWGFVAPRFNHHSVAAMLDGHVEDFNPRQTQDMRHWCNHADRPDWTLPQ